MGKLIYKGRVISGSPKVTNTVEKDNMLPVSSNAVAVFSDGKQNKEWVQLWKSPNGYTNPSYNEGNFDMNLSDDWTKYNELMIICGYATYSIPSEPSVIPTSFLKDFYSEVDNDWGVMLGGYGTCYLYIKPISNTVLRKNGGDSSTPQGVYAIYAR